MTTSITSATSIETVRDQTLIVRQMIASLLKAIPDDKVDAMPEGWNNNARWHAGHLIITPLLLTYGIAKQPLPVPAEYRRWFAKGTSPRDWGNDSIPGYRELVDEVAPVMDRLFTEWRDRLNEPFPEPYTTSVGVVLRSAAEGLNFSAIHDGIHLGLLLALRRSI